MKFEYMSVYDIAYAFVDVIRTMVRGLQNEELRLYNRQLVTIRNENAIAKKILYININGSLKRIDKGEEYNRPVKYWMNFYDDVAIIDPLVLSSDAKFPLIHSTGDLIITSITDHYNSSWYYKRSSSNSLRLDFNALFYGFSGGSLLDLMIEYIESLSKTKFKALNNVIRKYKDPIKLFRKLNTIFKIEFPVVMNGKYTNVSYYGLEPMPTKEEERDRIINYIIKSKLE
jgi:hypothetical protein